MILGKVGVVVRDEDGHVIPGLLRTGDSRIWISTADAWVPHTGIFHRPLDMKGRIEVFKVQDGQRVPHGDAGREAIHSSAGMQLVIMLPGVATGSRGASHPSTR